jgi:hypothetical protein
MKHKNNNITYFNYDISYYLNFIYNSYYNNHLEYLSNFTEENNYIFIKNYNKNLPKKFIFLANHDYKQTDLFTLIYFMVNYLYNYKIKIIVGSNIGNFLNFLENIGIDLDFIYYLDKNKNIYLDIYNFTKKNEYCCVIFFPEGRITRYSIPFEIDPNTKYHSKFKIIEKNTFNYKNGAFILSYISNIPIIQSIFYNSCPNFKYNFFNKRYNIKHINHRGIIILKENIQSYSNINNINKNNIDTFINDNINIIENNKNFYQNNFIINYIKVLQKAHYYNKIFN